MGNVTDNVLLLPHRPFRPLQRDELLLSVYPAGGDQLILDADPSSLGPALEDYHDNIQRWLRDKDDKPIPGAAGMAAFFLNYESVKVTGQPIRALPPPPQLAEAVRVEAMKSLQPIFARVIAQQRAIEEPLIARQDDPRRESEAPLTGKLTGDASSRRAARIDDPLPFNPILMARTIHGTRVLAENADAVFRTLRAEFSRARPRGGSLEFESYVQSVEPEIISCAERFDPGRGKFTTFIHRAVRFQARRFVRELPRTVELDAYAGYDGAEGRALRYHEIIADTTSSYWPGGIRSEMPGGYDDWFAEGVTDFRRNTFRDILRGLTEAGMITRREREILFATRENVAAVAEKYALTINNLYVVRFRVKERLRRYLVATKGTDLSRRDLWVIRGKKNE